MNKDDIRYKEMDIDEAIERIKVALKKRTRRAWSVKKRKVSWGRRANHVYIDVSPMPRDMVDYERPNLNDEYGDEMVWDKKLSPEQMEQLRTLFSLPKGLAKWNSLYFGPRSDRAFKALTIHPHDRAWIIARLENPDNTEMDGAQTDAIRRATRLIREAASDAKECLEELADVFEDNIAAATPQVSTLIERLKEIKYTAGDLEGPK